ncbi:hypothetical protein DWF00_20245 [Bosea caraganae]|uniref:Uncharacterized protein n=1 Tax=Bosea caraganae TaxID=2763117 RepID=A0A370KY71_9HYPH|nr:hypothetical protein [Bosea caraganae]RDJ19949.1 hypothetical protein DWE98_26770 [Bosea caraganae]RDJ23888.1 hypothetical protein DWF00_20245 [Bosea caraganae]
MKTRIEQKTGETESGTPHFTIETVEDYELAKRRIAALDDATRGEDEEQEHAALVKAVRSWDEKHDRRPL